jgi:ABC-type multidrug transport system fused ATPase/permease subunit
MKKILTVIKKHKWKLIKIYLYVIFAQALYLLEPFLLGKAIDGLISGSYHYLSILLVVFLAENVFMYRRMVYDTKVYVDMYNDIVFDYLRRDKDSDASSKIARTEMANNIIGFFENELHFFVMSIMSVIGSLYFIFLGSIMTGIVVVTCVPVIAFIVYCLYKKIAKATRIGNSHYEQKIGIMSMNDMTITESFFKRRKRVIVSQSTLQAKHWASLNSTKSIFLILAIIVFTRSADLTQGQAVSMFAYINQFLISLMSIPIGVETYTRVRDSIQRLHNC